jgi:hypothetical protein
MLRVPIQITYHDWVSPYQSTIFGSLCKGLTRCPATHVQTNHAVTNHLMTTWSDALFYHSCINP